MFRHLTAPGAALVLFLAGPAALFAQFAAHDTDCSGLKLQSATGVPGATVHTYAFSGTCLLYRDDDDGITAVQNFPAQAKVIWDAGKHRLIEDFTTLGGFKYAGKVMGGQVHSEFNCNDDPMVILTAACNGVDHWNHSAIDPLSNPYHQFRPITYQRTTLAEATKMSGATGQGGSTIKAPEPKATTPPKMLSSPGKKDTIRAPGRMLSTPAAASQVIEGESLFPSAQKSSGQLLVQDMAPFGGLWSNGRQLAWSPGQPGAQLRLAPSIHAAGRYEVAVVFTKGPDYGSVMASFDGAPPRPFNGYAPQVVKQRLVIGTYVLKAGGHELLLAISGKDAHSTGLLAGVDRIEFTARP